MSAPKFAVRVTRFIKTNGPLTKKLHLDASGKIANDSSQCRMARGKAQTVTITSAEEFAKFIDETKSNEAWSNGVLKDGQSSAKIVASRKLKASASKGAIARTLAFFEYPKGQQGALHLDVDRKGAPPEALSQLEELGGVFGVLRAVIPSFDACACVWRRSTSSALYNAETGEEYPNSGGWRVIVIIDDAGEIPRITKVLKIRLTAMGLGWGMVSRSGAYLERCLVDATVASPERLIFDAAADTDPPLMQDKDKRRCEWREGAPAAAASIADPSPEEAARSEAFHKQNRARLAPKMAEAREAWIQGHVARAVAAGRPEREARAQFERCLNTKELSGDFPLEFDDEELGVTTVAAVLRDPGKFKDESLCDPFEGSEYGYGKARLYVNDDHSIIVHSCAHGLSVSFKLVEPSSNIIDFEAERLARLTVDKYAMAAPGEARRLGINRRDLDTIVREAKRRLRDEERGEAPPWFDQLRRNEKGQIVPDLSNAAIAIRGEPTLFEAFSYDEMACAVLVLKPVPLAPGAKPGAKPNRKLLDDDVARLQEWLQYWGLLNVAFNTVGQAVYLVARERRFHPIRDWLNSLKWDGTPRLDDLWIRYFGATGNVEYLRASGSMFVISMVARIFEPGCKVDYVPILQGPQGIEKSKACAILAGNQYFSDDMPPLHSKDAKQHLRGKWLIEWAELTAFKKADNETVKAFVTRRTESYRPPYGKEEVEEPRQCVFIGSENPIAGSSKDVSGARRIWPIVCGRIDIEALERDRDQLFAEAVHRYRAREKWWPDRETEATLFKPEQDALLQEDPWEELIADYLHDLPFGDSEVTILRVARGALGFAQIPEKGETSFVQLSAPITQRIAENLRRIGWEPGKQTKDLGRVWIPAKSKNGEAKRQPPEVNEEDQERRLMDWPNSDDDIEF